MTAEEFVDKIQGAFIDRMLLLLDTEPTFNKTVVPFKFDYSFLVTLITNKGAFRIISAATFNGTETFWIEQVEEKLVGNKVIEIGSNIQSIKLKTAKDFQHPFKMSIEFDNKEIFLFCGEIYDDIDGSLKYNLNDEMIFVFDERQEAMRFEKLINHG
jgi:hypothetical protein